MIQCDRQRLAPHPDWHWHDQRLASRASGSQMPPLRSGVKIPKLLPGTDGSLLNGKHWNTETLFFWIVVWGWSGCGLARQFSVTTTGSPDSLEPKTAHSYNQSMIIYLGTSRLKLKETVLALSKIGVVGVAQWPQYCCIQYSRTSWSSYKFEIENSTISHL